MLSASLSKTFPSFLPVLNVHVKIPNNNNNNNTQYTFVILSIAGALPFKKKKIIGVFFHQSVCPKCHFQVRYYWEFFLSLIIIRSISKTIIIMWKQTTNTLLPPKKTNQPNKQQQTKITQTNKQTNEKNPAQNKQNRKGGKKGNKTTHTKTHTPNKETNDLSNGAYKRSLAAKWKEYSM